MTEQTAVTLYYSTIVVDRLLKWAADGSPAAHRRIAEQHAVILRLAMWLDPPEGLTVSNVSLPNVSFCATGRSPWNYHAVLNEQLTHVVSLAAEALHTEFHNIDVCHAGVEPRRG